MKYCNCNEDNLPTLNPGEVVKIDGVYYIATSNCGKHRLFNLHSGNIKSEDSFWGDVDEREVIKVDVCFKEC